LPAPIDTQAALDEFVDALSDQPALAVDTESNSFYAYRPRVCLLQVSIPGRDELVDPLAGLDLDGLGAVLADPGRRVVLHAAENDVIALKHEFGWTVPGLFDTQIASFVLGLKPYSLAGILEARFGVALDKSEQRSDWGRRPLTDKQVAYAAEDTHYLLELADDLRQRAIDAGRLPEIESECRRIAERDWEPEPFDPDAFGRMSGAKELDGVGLRILRDLFLLRNAEAERRDRAPFRVVPDQALMLIARERVTADRKGIPKGFWQRYGHRVAGIVRSAKDRDPIKLPRRKSNRGAPTPPKVKTVYEALRRWRSGAAEERGVEPWVVARNELLLRIAQAAPRDEAELGELMAAFRLEEYGAAILAVLRKNAENA
jgi:ribonuclease D